MKNLMVATDLSERSDRAMDRAVLLAQESGAKLTVLHIVDNDLPSKIMAFQRRAAEEGLRDHLASLPGAEKINVELVIRSGQGPTEILRQSSSGDADLLILGLHRRRGLAEWFRGTTVERVVRNGDTPVLVVKNRATGPYRSLVVGVDFSLNSRRAVEFSGTLAPQAKMHLVHAYEVPFKGFLSGPETESENRKHHLAQFDRVIEQEMSGLLNSIGPGSFAMERVMREGAPQGVLHNMVQELPADLLVLGTHGRTGTARSLLGSVTEAFLTDPPCDVLTLKAW